MLLHEEPLFAIGFQDRLFAQKRDVYFADISQEELFKNKAIVDAKNHFGFQAIILCRQVHGNQGYVVTNENYSSFLRQRYLGDYLITSMPGIALAVYAADCLPIVFYDSIHNTLGICHAGWQGSVRAVALCTVQAMQREFGTQLDNLKIFLGPAAGSCCYEVTPDFQKHLEPFSYACSAVRQRDKQLFFDVALFNKLQLEEYGIPGYAFNAFYNACTIHEDRFCSYRREGMQASRQLSIAVLKIN